MTARWRTGDVILERHVFGGTVTIGRPARVVAADDDRLVTWVVPETEVAFPNERVPPYSGTFVRPWHPPGMLQLVRTGDPYALALLRDRDDRFRGWYVNLQEPMRMTELGYDTRDNILDLWHPRNGDWRWKDEDELAQAVSRDVFTPDDATAFHAAGTRAMRELELPTGWEDWTPDPAWTASSLPNGWDEP